MADDFMTAQEALFAAYGAGDYARALGLALETRQRHPTRAARAEYWIACLQCKLGRPDEALSTLEASLEAGRWPNPDRLRSDPDLEPIREHPRLLRVLDLCEHRRHAQQATARPELRVRSPAASSLAAHPPLLVALHMRGGDAEETLYHWRTAIDEGAILAAPQGSHVEGPYEFAWGPDSEAEIGAHVAALQRERTFDRERVVLAGASQGARLAVSLALRGSPLESRGFIAVVGAPELDATLLAAAARAARRGLRGVFLTGTSDFGRGTVERAHADVTAAGVDARIEVVPGLGHAFPVDFGERLRSALAFVLADD